MDQKTDSLYPSAPIQQEDLEQRLGKMLNYVNSFINQINNIEEMIAYFKYKNNKSKKRYMKYKTLTTVIKSFDTIVIIATTNCTITLGLIGIGLIVIPILQQHADYH